MPEASHWKRRPCVCTSFSTGVSEYGAERQSCVLLLLLLLLLSSQATTVNRHDLRTAMQAAVTSSPEMLVSHVAIANPSLWISLLLEQQQQLLEKNNRIDNGAAARTHATAAANVLPYTPPSEAHVLTAARLQRKPVRRDRSISFQYENQRLIDAYAVLTRAFPRTARTARLHRLCLRRHAAGRLPAAILQAPRPVHQAERLPRTRRLPRSRPR